MRSALTAEDPAHLLRHCGDSTGGAQFAGTMRGTAPSTSAVSTYKGPPGPLANVADALVQLAQ
jgi:hypothetical protein